METDLLNTYTDDLIPITADDIVLLESTNSNDAEDRCFKVVDRDQVDHDYVEDKLHGKVVLEYGDLSLEPSTSPTEYVTLTSTSLAPHPFLDMEEQRQVVANEKWREHVKWCDRLSVAQRLSYDNRTVALKVLINEAFCRDLAFSRSKPEWNAESERALRADWKKIVASIMHDLQETEGGVVLRNLSCMCIFIPQDVTRNYGENHEARIRRMENMKEGLRRLRERGALFHSAESDVKEASTGSSNNVSDSATSSDGETDGV